MEPDGQLKPSSLGVKDMPWQIVWNKDKCTLCGQCAAVCPVQAIGIGVHRKRVIQAPLGLAEKPSNVYGVYHGVSQKTDVAHACTGCGMCAMVCPNGAIMPLPGHERVVPALYFLRDSRTDCAKAGKKVVIIGAWKTKFNVHNSQQECMQRADVRL